MSSKFQQNYAQLRALNFWNNVLKAFNFGTLTLSTPGYLAAIRVPDRGEIFICFNIIYSNVAGRVSIETQYRLNTCAVIMYHIMCLYCNLYSLYAVISVNKDLYLFLFYLLCSASCAWLRLHYYLFKYYLLF